MHGKIKYFHTRRGYGVIEAVDKTYIFFPDRFREVLNAEALNQLDGKKLHSAVLGKDKEI